MTKMTFNQDIQSWGSRFKNQCNQPFQQAEEEKLYNHINWQWKNTWQNIKPLQYKNSQQVRNRKELSQLGKEHKQKHYIVNIKLSDKRLNAFTLRWGKRQECHPYHLNWT